MKTHTIKLTSTDIEMILDALLHEMTEFKYKTNPKRADQAYETYQTIGQTLGEKDIKLTFTEVTTK